MQPGAISLANIVLIGVALQVDYIAFQEFLPMELKESGHCIWCGLLAPANRAHIISKKLTKHAETAPTLHFRVCESCNSKCGEIEQWILRRSPLSWIQMMLYAVPSASRQSQFPSYFFSDLLQEWIIFHLDGASHSYVVPTQLILARTQELTLLTQESEAKYMSIAGNAWAALHVTALQRDIRPSLPSDFSARILIPRSLAAIIVARSEEDAERVIKAAQDLETQTEERCQVKLGNTGREHYHFQWSNRNWVRFCAKTALEALCLFEGGDTCLGSKFASVRNFVINGDLASGKELVFNQQGPKSDSDVPSGICVDLTADQGAPEIIPCITLRCETESHAVILYEIRGWISASVVFAGLPPTILIMAGPDAHLSDFYQMVYDGQDGKYHFLRLAYDQTRPIIPLPLPGWHFKEIVDTYNLTPA